MSASTTLATAPLWYVTRGSALVGFVLMTITLLLGIVARTRTSPGGRWPRVATQELHRNLSLLAVAMLAVHIGSVVLDEFVDVGWWAVLVPGASGYRATWVSLGTIAVDLLLLIVGTSLLRHRLPLKVWRGVHWTAYAIWPLAWLHFVKVGTDSARGHWAFWLAIVSLALVAGAVTMRSVARFVGPAGQFAKGTA